MVVLVVRNYLGSSEPVSVDSYGLGNVSNRLFHEHACCGAVSRVALACLSSPTPLEGADRHRVGVWVPAGNDGCRPVPSIAAICSDLCRDSQAFWP